MSRRASDAQSTAQRGREHVRAELTRRGATVRPAPEGHVPYLEVVAPDDSRRVRVRVKTRASGTWQASVSDGGLDPRPAELPTFWAFVDLSCTPPRVYVGEDTDVRRDIHRAHREWLRPHGGVRPNNATSNHHGIDDARVRRWPLGWEALGLDLRRD